jgi:hypothetical protein
MVKKNFHKNLIITLYNLVFLIQPLIQWCHIGAVPLIFPITRDPIPFPRTMLIKAYLVDGLLTWVFSVVVFKSFASIFIEDIA